MFIIRVLNLILQTLQRGLSAASSGGCFTTSRQLIFSFIYLFTKWFDFVSIFNDQLWQWRFKSDNRLTDLTC